MEDLTPQSKEQEAELRAKEEDIVLDQKDPTPDSEHKPHPWPQPDENWCSCCRGRIIDGLHNVLRIATTPEKILDMQGKKLGEDNRKAQYSAYLHASCSKTHYGMKAECDICSGFSKYLRLQDGSINQCGCTCHRGSNHCSLILEPNAINNRVIRQFGGK